MGSIKTVEKILLVALLLTVLNKSEQNLVFLWPNMRLSAQYDRKIEFIVISLALLELTPCRHSALIVENINQ
jgi:hypothetical protein